MIGEGQRPSPIMEKVPNEKKGSGIPSRAGIGAAAPPSSPRRFRLERFSTRQAGPLPEDAMTVQPKPVAKDRSLLYSLAGGVVLAAVLFGFVPLEAQLWVKSLHILAVISWMAGMLYLPRLFVYHTEAGAGSPWTSPTE